MGGFAMLLFLMSDAVMLVVFIGRHVEFCFLGDVRSSAFWETVSTRKMPRLFWDLACSRAMCNACYKAYESLPNMRLQMGSIVAPRPPFPAQLAFRT